MLKYPIFNDTEEYLIIGRLLEEHKTSEEH